MFTLRATSSPLDVLWLQFVKECCNRFVPRGALRERERVKYD